MKRSLAKLFLLILLIPLLFLGVLSVRAQTQPPINAAYSPDEIIVKYKISTPEIVKSKLREKLQTVLKQKIDTLHVEILRVPLGKVHENIALFKNDPNIEYAEPNYIAKALAITNDTSLQQQWGLFKINAANNATQSAWDVTTGGANIKIAILDTGIQESHPDLTGKVVGSKNFTNSPTLSDLYGHGTHVAGIAAAATNNGNGVAGTGYNTVLLNGKVLGDNGSGTYAWIASGITWAADQGTQVISMSLGGTAGSQTLQDAVNYAWNKGSVVVAAAGNDGTSNPLYPAYYPNAIAIAATDSNDVKASWSNFGNWVDVAAPGVSIYSTYKDSSYATLSGTSMATPFAAGTAALIFMKGDCTTNICVRDQLEKTADKIPGTGSSFVWGRINAYAAVSSSVASIVTPTQTPTPAQLPTSTPTPTTKPQPTMTVSDIALSYITLSTSTRRITSIITLINETTNAPVTSGLVKTTITTPSGSVFIYSGVTSSNGKYTFKHRSSERGTFTTTVTDVTKSGYTYHPTVTSKSLLVQ